MTHKLADRVKETALSAGAGAFSLLGAPPTGFFSFADMLPVDGDTTWYCAFNGAQSETGKITRTSSTTFDRTEIYESSNDGDAVDFVAPPVVFCTVPASRMLPALAGPVFSARPTAQQLISSFTHTVIEFGATEIDTHNCFDTATSRFTPNVPGLYRFCAQVFLSSPGYTSTMVRKNGEIVAIGSAVNDSYSASAFVVLAMNGTTDYVDTLVSIDRSTTTHENPLTTNFAGEFIRS